MKRIKLTIKDIFEVPGSVIYNPDSFKDIYSVTIDSRNVKKGSLFIAIKGANYDGHDFIGQAVKSGAYALMINNEKLIDLAEYKIPVITVKDTTRALGDVAKIWRSKLKGKVIAITGSAGKTTTKEILFKILKEKYTVNKTDANNNNHIGVPLTLLSTNNNHQVLIAELGTNHFGEIPYTAPIAKPDLGMITNIGDSHLEFLKNRNGVLKEKSALLNETLANKGTIFINNDDPLLKKFGKNVKSKKTFAVNNKADYKIEVKDFDKLGRPLVNVKSKRISFETTLPISGISNTANYISAVAIAAELGLTTKQILNGTKKVRSYDKRLQVKNYRDFTIINDTYNANPDSMKAALTLLSKIFYRKRKISVLGDMFELGEQSKTKHQELASIINEMGIDEVYSTGKMMQFMDKKLNGSSTKHLYFQDSASLKKQINKIDPSDSVILFKGSRGMRMEEVLEIFESRFN